MALPLTTSADTFPVWQSAPIPLMSGMMVEYKFIIQREDREGPTTWQKFEGNYHVTPVDGKEVLLKMAESGVENAEAEVTSQCPLAVTLKKREMSRRNFSQSLLTLDVPKESEKPPESTPQSTTATEEPSKEPEATEPTGADAADAPDADAADVVVSQQPMEEEEGEAVEYEMPLKDKDLRASSAPDVRGGKGTDFLFIEGRGIQRDGGLYNDDDGREYPDPTPAWASSCCVCKDEDNNEQ
eukprot:Skav231003  [mRNA]  locus=scaffold1822:264129:269136:- [translate_table: standard]